jgi:molybdate transport system permease protein
VLVAAAAIGVLVLVLPLLGLLVRAPWSTLGQQLTAPGIADALRLSLVTATVSTAVCLALGVPLAWLLARVDFPGQRLLRTLVIVPLVLPPVVGGVALLSAFARNGFLGRWLYEATGATIPYTTTAVVLAQTFVALPFLVLSVEGALRSTDQRFDEAAVTLGASRLATFLRVTLPLAAPGLVSGAVLAWARALGEFGATVTFAGNVPGVTQTMPLKVYSALQTEPDAALVISLVLLAVSIGLLAGLRERWLPGAIR